MEDVKDKLTTRYGFVCSEDGCYTHDFCVIEFYGHEVKFTHPVTKTQYQLSEELLTVSGTQVLEEFIYMMLAEDRVSENVAGEVAASEGWVRTDGSGGRVKDNVFLYPLEDELQMAARGSMDVFPIRFGVKFSELRSALHLRHWLKETYHTIKMELL